MLKLDFKHALVIDDDESFGIATGRWLQDLGYEGRLVTTAKDAIAALNGDVKFSLILLDLHLPDISGHALLSLLNRQGFRCPVIVMSGAADVNDVIRVWREDAHDFLQKPFSIDELTRSIERANEVSAESSVPTPVATRGDRVPAGSPRVPATSAPPAAGPPRPAEPVTPATPFPGSTTPATSFPGSTTPATSSAVSLESGNSMMAMLNDALRDGSISIPVVDPNVANLQRFLTRSDYTMQDVADAVSRDGALAAGVLRIANSAQYSRGAAVSSLLEACSFLGANRVVGIALEVAVRNQFTLSDEPFRSIMSSIWKNAAVTARAAEHLGRATGRGDTDNLHLMGLLHNLGEVVCIKLFSDARRLGHSLPPVERMCAEIFAIHEQFGRAVATAWKLPKPLVKVIARHHRPASNPERPADRATRALIVGAWALAVENGYPYFPEHPQSESKKYLQLVDLKPEAVEKLVAEIPSWGI